MRAQNLDLERFRLPEEGHHRLPKTGRPPRRIRGEKFIRGPIPLSWLGVAAGLPGRSLAVALELWFWAGLRDQTTVEISLSNLRTASGISRSSASRGLAELERAGLVSVERHPGRKPSVTILGVNAAS
jgi:DNA-binding transcriptional ArsR family regulator